MYELIRKILALFQRKKINLGDYSIRMDYGTMNAQQRNAFDGILSACESGWDKAEIPVLTQAEFDEVVTHIGLHFGDDKICRNIALKRQNTALVNLDLYEKAREHKAKLDAWIEDAMSTLNEGTTEYKLRQIAKCVADNAKYECPSNNPLDLLDEGGMCGAYSMLFYKMATRIGVKAFICYGEADNGLYKGFHAWNMADGYFYDITWYDTLTRQPKYLHSKTPWGRTYKLNTR